MLITCCISRIMYFCFNNVKHFKNMSTNEINSVSNKIKEEPFKSVIMAFISGIIMATGFWVWFYTWRIDDLKSDYEKEVLRIKENYEMKLEINNNKNFKELPNDSIVKAKLDLILKNMENEKRGNK